MFAGRECYGYDQSLILCTREELGWIAIQWYFVCEIEHVETAWADTK